MKLKGKMLNHQPQNDLWKFVATGALSMIIGFVGHTLLVPVQKIPDGVLTQDTLMKMMPGLISEFSPYTGDQKEIATRMISVDERLTKIEAHQEQQARDIATIANKAHVYANPAP